MHVGYCTFREIKTFEKYKNRALKMHCSFLVCLIDSYLHISAIIIYVILMQIWKAKSHYSDEMPFAKQLQSVVDQYNTLRSYKAQIFFIRLSGFRVE